MIIFVLSILFSCNTMIVLYIVLYILYCIIIFVCAIIILELHFVV